ncbi:RagB/SusD family nutrient uptake outer membrane protein [Compostibacter hankyongensis]|uniref:RagB/SusD family nutrient uptake outer membrane protein n=1 Tax=Compostibacter hankyongensis TaxID=1007089 RepID=A0ABP8FIN0_9BACT
MQPNHKNQRFAFASKKLWLAALLFAGAMGCTKDFLKPKPKSFYVPETAYNTPEGLNAALVACERNMRYEWYGDGAPIITQMLFSDVAVDGTTDKSGPAQDLNLLITPDAVVSGSDNADHNRIFWYWSEGYKGIKYANTVIFYIDEPDWDTTSAEEMAQRNAILGAAYFHRAYRYYDLCNEFGDVPWVGKIYDYPKLDFQSVKREVILQQIKKDLEFAAEWVPDNTDKGTVTKGAVLHLLTKVNLALGDFDDAIASASAVIDGGTYHLMTDRFGTDADDASKNVIWDLHQSENKSIAANKEALMLVIDKPDVDGKSGGISVMRQCVPEFYAAINTPAGNKGTTDKVGVEFDLTTMYGRGIGRCRPSNYSQFSLWDNDAGDLRHAPGNWVNMEDMVYNEPDLKRNDPPDHPADPYYGKHLQLHNSAGTLLCSDTIRCWFGWPYYKLYVPDNINSQPQGGNGDWYVFRLAETYLLRAEAYYWKGNLAAAADDLNKVKARAQAPLITAGQVNIGSILDERARELYYEEPRKVELTRIAYLFAKTGKPAYNGKTYSLDNFSTDNFFYDRVMEKNNFYKNNITTIHGDRYTMSPYHVLWPIPQKAINDNTQARINQNKGYTGAENNIPPLDKIPED